MRPGQRVRLGQGAGQVTPIPSAPTSTPGAPTDSTTVVQIRRPVVRVLPVYTQPPAAALRWERRCSWVPVYDPFQGYGYGYGYGGGVFLT